MPIIDIQGVQHVYNLTSTTSSPSVLVFIHGWLLSRHYWDPVIQRLQSDYQCLSYDLRGFGESQLTPENLTQASAYTPVSYAEDLAHLLDQLKIESAWLIGHSLGGTIALFGADQLPQQVKGVICVNAGGGIYLQEEFARFRKAGEQIVKFRPRWLCNLPLLDLVFTRTQVNRPISRQWGRQRIVDFVVAHPEAALGALLDSTTEAEVHRLPKLVSDLKQPVYFLAGVQDKVMELQYVRHLAQFHWLSQQGTNNVIEIPNCGHMAMVEQPDAIATHLQTLLKQNLEG